MRKPRSFSHPLSSRYDERLAALIGERGHAGYGLYWMLIEIIQSEDEMRIYYSEHRIRRLSAMLGITSEEFKNFVNDLVYVYELLSLEDYYLASAITYRRPRKPKPTPQSPEPIPSTDTEPTPSAETPEPFSDFVTATFPQEPRKAATRAPQQHLSSSTYNSITAAKSPIIPLLSNSHPAFEPVQNKNAPAVAEAFNCFQSGRQDWNLRPRHKEQLYVPALSLPAGRQEISTA